MHRGKRCHLLTVHGGREAVALESEVQCDGAAQRDRHRLWWRGDWWEFSARQLPCNGAPITRGEVGPGLPPAGSSVIPTLW